MDGSILDAKGDKILVRRKTEYAILEPKEGQKFEKKLPLAGLETIDPVAEWQQIFTDAWRLERDYFYDPGCTARTGTPCASGMAPCSRTP